ncbi:MAG TPA: rhomboid family intramembrane serine protease [Steroidobacteraceae bacterium]|nr:rhomboid family intramembrane serine protease [Steroidobacteraceae bacterium]
MFPKLTPATRAIILVNVLVFVVELLLPRSVWGLFALWPLATPDRLFRPWQLVTYAFLHEGVTHIFFNMFALYVFGPALESFWGARRFLGYYLVCVIAAGATQLAVEYAMGAGEPTIGASGGIFGILLAFALLFPRARLLLYFAIPVPAWLFVSGYAVLELFFGVTGRQASVAHFAHLGGMLGGALMMLYWRLRSDRGGWRPT